MSKETKKWVYGNNMTMAVRLQEKTFTEQGETTAPYYPPEGSEVTVRLVGQFKSRNYDCTVDGDTVIFADDGTLPIGVYGVEVMVKEERNLRSFHCCEIEIIRCSDELGDVPASESVILEGQTFIWAKGEKGDKGDSVDIQPMTNIEIEEIINNFDSVTISI